MSQKLLVDKRSLEVLLFAGAKEHITPAQQRQPRLTIPKVELDSQSVLVKEQVTQAVVQGLAPGPGFTPGEQADLREEYKSWPVQELAAAFGREMYKAQLLLEILSERLITDKQGQQTL